MLFVHKRKVIIGGCSTGWLLMVYISGWNPCSTFPPQKRRERGRAQAEGRMEDGGGVQLCNNVGEGDYSSQQQ